MKRFIVHGIYFLLAFCLTQVACNNLLLKNIGDSYYHNKQFATQYQNYLASQEQYNTVFIGSSRTYRQIDPQIIDSTLSEYSIKSYNLGAPATFMPETYHLLEVFLENQPQENPVKYIFLELPGINNIKLVNWFAPQSYYYLDIDILKLICKINFQNPEYNWAKACMYTYPFFQGFIIKNIMPQSLLAPSLQPDSYTGENDDGYYPLDLEVEQHQPAKLVARRANLLADTTILLKRIESQARWPKENLTGAFADHLNQLVEKAEQKNIKLYFIIPPKLKNYFSIAPLQDLIPDQRVIDMGSYKENPHLNFLEYNHDHGHFNSKGAELFSEYLALKIKARL